VETGQLFDILSRQVALAHSCFGLVADILAESQAMANGHEPLFTDR
jgi:hypothetical protein